MPAYTVTFEVTRQAPTNTLPVIRDFGIAAGDDFTLRLRIYAQDGDAAPVNVTGAEGTLTLWERGETQAALTVAGTVVTPATGGSVDFYFAPQFTSELSGRFLWAARIELTSGSVVARGSLNIRETLQAVDAVAVTPTPDPDPDPGTPTGSLLTEGGAVILTEAGAALLVEA